MSFLILAFRKLSLKRQINRGNFKLMNISMTQQSIQNKLASLESVKTTLSQAWDTAKSTASTLSGSVFTAQVNTANENADKYTQAYAEIENSGDESAIAKALQQRDEAIAYANEMNTNAWKQQSAQAIANVQLDQAVASLWETANKAQMTALNKQDQQYDLQKESLNTQMTAWEAEYSGLDKSVQSAAKAAAPQYVA